MSEGADNDASSQSFGTSSPSNNRPGMGTSGGTRLTDSSNNSGFNSQSCQCWKKETRNYLVDQNITHLLYYIKTRNNYKYYAKIIYSWMIF